MKKPNDCAGSAPVLADLATQVIRDPRRQLSGPAFRRFALYRVEDLTGVSGVGVVALGLLWPSGKCAMQWRETKPVGPGAVALYDTLDQLLAIHGHDGRAVILWIDREEPVFVLAPCGEAAAAGEPPALAPRPVAGSPCDRGAAVSDAAL
jgi:hypothetical protein